MLICVSWGLLGVRASAETVTVERVATQVTVKVVARQTDRVNAPVRQQWNRIIAQSSSSISTNTEIDKDLRLQGITITQDRIDKSLLTVRGFINNRGDQTHYVYYVVAKFIANDTAIKQTVIPVNIEIEPGQSKPFVHEISTDNVDKIVPAAVKPLVIKYEYR